MGQILYPKMKAIFDKQKRMDPFFFSRQRECTVNWRGVVTPIDEVICRRLYRQHCADVLRNCPKEKLLILDSPNCGWKILCDFIGVDVPVETPWPHKNKKGQIAEDLFKNQNARIPMAVRMEINKRIKIFGTVLLLIGGSFIYSRFASG